MRKLLPPQEKYSAFDRKLLEGRRFKLLTDHKLLFAALHCVSQQWSARQQHQLEYLSNFDRIFEHISGDANVVADALSRPPRSSTVPVLADTISIPMCPGIDYVTMAVEQIVCQDIQHLASSKYFKVIKFDVDGKSLLCNTSMTTPQLLVPTLMRNDVFHAIHDLAHPGRHATTCLVSSKFVWTGLSCDIKAWTSHCLPCQSSKITQHTSAPICLVLVPDVQFSSVIINIVGPLLISDGYRYLLTTVDRTTRWPEAFPVTDTGNAGERFYRWMDCMLWHANIDH